MRFPQKDGFTFLSMVWFLKRTFRGSGLRLRDGRNDFYKLWYQNSLIGQLYLQKLQAFTRSGRRTPGEGWISDTSHYETLLTVTRVNIDITDMHF